MFRCGPTIISVINADWIPGLLRQRSFPPDIDDAIILTPGHAQWAWSLAEFATTLNCAVLQIDYGNLSIVRKRDSIALGRKRRQRRSAEGFGQVPHRSRR